VTNDPNAKSSYGIRQDAIADGIIKPSSATPFVGETDRNNPYSTFTASDSTDPQDALSTQIFELGNALDIITGKMDPNKSEADAHKLEDCYKKGGPGK